MSAMSRRSTVDDLDSETVMSPASPPVVTAGGQLQAVVIGAELLKVYALPAAGDVTIGRHRGSGIPIDHETISRFHAVIHLGPPHTIEDLGSANGVSVDGVRLSPGTRQTIELGKVVMVGSIVLVLQKRP